MCDLHAAALVLAHATDICDVFVTCKTLPRSPDGCSKPSAGVPEDADALINKVQAAYGAFREAFMSLASPGSDGAIADYEEFLKREKYISRRDMARFSIPYEKWAPPEPLPLDEVLAWAALARAPGCGRYIDLVLRKRDRQPLLHPLANLLSHAPAGACTRVFVYEDIGNITMRGSGRNRMLRSWRRRAPHRPTGSLPSWDARDGLLDVQRIALAASTEDSFEALLAAHRAHSFAAKSRGQASADAGSSGGGGSGGGANGDSPTIGEADTTVVFSGVSGLLAYLEGTPGFPKAHDEQPYCRARTLLSHQYGSPLMPLPGGAVAWRLPTAAALANTTSPVGPKAERWTMTSACATRDVSYHNRKTQARQRRTRAVAMLISHTARLIHPSGKPDGGGGGSGGGGGGSSSPGGSIMSDWRINVGYDHFNLTRWSRAIDRARPPWRSVPLACLEADFMDYNRELTLLDAAGALSVCDSAAVAASAALARQLHEDIETSQNAAACQLVSYADAPPKARKRVHNAVVGVSLHPSGFFSLLHGLLKPLMATLREQKVLLTPRVAEFTSAKFKPMPCVARDLSCFLEPLSPPCDAVERDAYAVTLAERAAREAAKGKGGKGNGGKGLDTGRRPRDWPAFGPRATAARSAAFVAAESRAAGKTPDKYIGRGWFWWVSHLLAHVIRPNPALAAEAASMLQRTGMRGAIDSGRLIVAVHVRHGDSCRAEEIARSRRSCTPLEQYMKAARRLVGGGGSAGGAGGRAGQKPVVYLATDSAKVVRESRAYASEFEIVHIGDREGIGRHDPKDGDAILWDRRIWQRFYWGQTDWTQQAAWTATAELLVLAHADVFVGKFTSNMFRAAYALRAAQCDCAPLFVSLDAPMCFDYGKHAGRNWEFPVQSTTPHFAVRNRSDALFQC